MTLGLPVGRQVTVDVPATSANLGPGFDALGVALGWRDKMTVAISSEPGFELSGVGADSVPRDESHLVIRACRTALADLGADAPALSLTAHNTIPHGSGLGSSAAAVVAGAAAAWGLVRPGETPAPDWLLHVTFDFEGHGDNLAAAIHGGAVLAWRDQMPRAVKLDVDHTIRAVAYTTELSMATRAARGVLPEAVPHDDAAVNAGRAGLLVHALGHRPDLLFEATEDRLHQSYRAEMMPESSALVAALRDRHFAAFLSGAGPTVVVLGEATELEFCEPADGFAMHRLRIASGVRLSAE